MSRIYQALHRMRHALVFGGVTSFTAVAITIFTESKPTLTETIEKSRDLIQRVKDENGLPGIVVTVSKDGNIIWNEGFGYADLENRVLCHPQTMFRVASISKSITMTMVAKLWEAGKLDLDKPIQTYVKDFPEKIVNGKKVTITTRHLVSHLSGIRDYILPATPSDGDQNPSTTLPASTPVVSSDDSQSHTNTKAPSTLREEGSAKKGTDLYKVEMYNTRPYETVSEALTMFKDHELFHEPGAKFQYSTHAWTLVSAILENVSGVQFPDLITQLFTDLGLTHTTLDRNRPLIYHRARQYEVEKGKVVNAPSVDNSYKWAGGGLLSTAEDLVKLGNAMLYSYQYRMCDRHGSDRSPNNVSCDQGDTVCHGDNSDAGKDHNVEADKEYESNFKGKSKVAKSLENVGGTSTHLSVTGSLHSSEKDLRNGGHTDASSRIKTSVCLGCELKPGYLKPDTVSMLWTPVVECSYSRGRFYGMGWDIMPAKSQYGMCRDDKCNVAHTGGAVGGSSVLLIVPSRSCHASSTTDAPHTLSSRHNEAMLNSGAGAASTGSECFITNHVSPCTRESQAVQNGPGADGSDETAQRASDTTPSNIDGTTATGNPIGNLEEICDNNDNETCDTLRAAGPPKGIVVAIITNSSKASLMNTAINIAKEFDGVERLDSNLRMS